MIVIKILIDDWYRKCGRRSVLWYEKAENQAEKSDVQPLRKHTKHSTWQSDLSLSFSLRCSRRRFARELCVNFLFNSFFFFRITWRRYVSNFNPLPASHEAQNGENHKTRVQTCATVSTGENHCIPTFKSDGGVEHKIQTIDDGLEVGKRGVWTFRLVSFSFLFFFFFSVLEDLVVS